MTRPAARARARDGATTALAAAAFLLGAVGGCVTEEKPTPPRAAQRETRPAGIDLDRPIARPALEGRTINARVVAALTPLGSVPFDGHVLPLVSPDARRLATQVGEAPPWDALLARRGASPTLRTSIEIWDISASPASRVTLRPPLRGLMLGRGADARGFLVEQILPDGARRIGRASWLTGDIQWLVDDGRVNAFAQWLPGGTLAWSARDIDADAFELTLAGTRIAAGAGISFLFPMAGAEPDLLYVFESSARATELQARSVNPGDPAGSHVVARRSIAAGADPIIAYQAADPVRGSAHPSQGDATPGLLLFHPGAGRMAVFDPGRGQMLALADSSIGGAWAPDSGGWAVLVTTPQGLEHQRLVTDEGLWEALPAARALADPWIARSTASDERPFVLIGPDPNDPRRIMVVGMKLLEE